jgi:hypothetical protein
MIMYDRQTELVAAVLWRGHRRRTDWPAARAAGAGRVARSVRRPFPSARILAEDPTRGKPYGRNPMSHDTAHRPFLFRGDYDGPVPALARPVSVGEDAWPLERCATRA